MRRVNPKQLILQLIPRECPECKNIQFVFFRSTEEYDEWDCPECRKLLDNETPNEVESDET